jgi:hypothetical protein
VLDQHLVGQLERDADLAQHGEHEGIERRARALGRERIERLVHAEVDDLAGLHQVDRLARAVGRPGRAFEVDALGAVGLGHHREAAVDHRGGDLGRGIVGELLQELDHRRQVGLAAQQLGLELVVEMQHLALAGLGAEGLDRRPVERGRAEQELAGMAVGEPVAQRRAVGVGLDPAGQAAAIGLAVGIAAAVGVEQLQLQAVDRARPLAEALDHEAVAGERRVVRSARFCSRRNSGSARGRIRPGRRTGTIRAARALPRRDLGGRQAEASPSGTGRGCSPAPTTLVTTVEIAPRASGAVR